MQSIKWTLSIARDDDSMHCCDRDTSGCDQDISTFEWMWSWIIVVVVVWMHQECIWVWKSKSMNTWLRCCISLIEWWRTCTRVCRTRFGVSSVPCIIAHCWMTGHHHHQRRIIVEKRRRRRWNPSRHVLLLCSRQPLTTPSHESLCCVCRVHIVFLFLVFCV